MTIDLTGKTALVCGSSQGIGQATAIAMAAAGARVVLLARDEKGLLAVKQQLSTDAGQEHDHLVADFTNPSAVQQRVTDWVQQHGTLHILVNNTGGPKGGPLNQAATDELEHAFKMHVVVNQLLAQAVVPGMKEAGYGRILNVISTSVKAPIPGLGVSNTIRGAVASWSKTLAGELGPHGITVNNVLPGFTDTARLDAIITNKAHKAECSEATMAQRMKDGVPARRFGKPEELAHAITFLASPMASYINGINLPVDGGRTQSL